jgi:LPXTG-motif cell wall-anchored protein
MEARVLKIMFGLLLLLGATPAWAATFVPGPEIGANIPVLAVVGGIALIAGATIFFRRQRK